MAQSTEQSLGREARAVAIASWRCSNRTLCLGLRMRHEQSAHSALIDIEAECWMVNNPPKPNHHVLLSDDLILLETTPMRVLLIDPDNQASSPIVHCYSRTRLEAPFAKGNRTPTDHP